MTLKEKKYQNNYTLAGVSALMYNIELDRLFDPSNSYSVFPEYDKLTDVGFEWKQTSQSQWTKVSIVKYRNNKGYVASRLNINNGSTGDTSMGDNYKCIMYSTAQVNKTFPCRIMITNLGAGQTYDIRSYYTNNGTTTYYNQTSQKLLTGRGNISFNTPTFTSAATENVSEDTLNEFKNKIVEAAAQTSEIFGMWYNNFNKTVDIIIDYDTSSNWAAKAGQDSNEVTFNSHYTSETTDQIRSVLIHELGHVYMKIDNNNPKGTYKDKIIKFMEFATDSPYAMWKWQGKHCYPIISSNRYQYVDDCLVVYAYSLSRQIYDT